MSDDDYCDYCRHSLKHGGHREGCPELRIAELEAKLRSKCYRNHMKVKAGLGADGLWHIQTEGSIFGTIHVDGSTQAEAVADLLETIEPILEAARLGWRDDVLELLDLVESGKFSFKLAKVAVEFMHEHEMRLHPAIDLRGTA